MGGICIRAAIVTAIPTGWMMAGPGQQDKRLSNTLKSIYLSQSIIGQFRSRCPTVATLVRAAVLHTPKSKAVLSSPASHRSFLAPHT
jgi:hypothetical protein